MRRVPLPRPERVVLIGASAGGVEALRQLLGGLSADFAWPLLVVLHVAESDVSGLVSLFAGNCALAVREAAPGTRIGSGVYLAPGNYHLLVETDRTLTLSIDARVCHARPSIDVLFQSAADSLGADAIGVVLTGANEDGAAGLAAIRAQGGLALIQNPAEAEQPAMPRAALQKAGADAILSLSALAARLNEEFSRCR